MARGGTHMMEIWTVWFPSYWLAGALKAVTACFSVVAATLLIQVTALARNRLPVLRMQLVNQPRMWQAIAFCLEKRS